MTPHQFGQDRTGSLSPCFGSISGVSWVTKQEDHSLKIHKMPRQPTLGLINCAPNPTWRPRDLVRGRDQLYRNTRSSQDSVHAPGSQGAVSGSTGHPRLASCPGTPPWRCHRTILGGTPALPAGVLVLRERSTAADVARPHARTTAEPQTELLLGNNLQARRARSHSCCIRHQQGAHAMWP